MQPRGLKITENELCYSSLCVTSAFLLAIMGLLPMSAIRFPVHCMGQAGNSLLVRRLVDSRQLAGHYRVSWDGKSENGALVASSRTCTSWRKEVRDQKDNDYAKV